MSLPQTGMLRNWTDMSDISSIEVQARYGIPREELSSFKDMVRIYSHKQPIIREGDVDRYLFLLRYGSVAIFRNIEGSQEQIDTIEAVNFFGEMRLINDEARSATVSVNSEEAVVYAIARPNVNIILSNPKWAELLITRLTKNLARNNANKVADAHKIHKLEGEVERLKAELETQRAANLQTLLHAQSALDAVLYFETQTRDRAIVGSKGWAFLKALVDLTKSVARHYLPGAEISERTADQRVVRKCLEDVQKITPGVIFEELDKS